MADVFISYSRTDKRTAEILANAVSLAGHSVWWDVNLMGLDKFRDRIQAELRAAMAVIVIWSPHSATSTFVRQEAQEALHFNKLIATRVSGMEILDVPLGFREHHIELVENTERILAAVEMLLNGADEGRGPDSKESKGTAKGLTTPDAFKQAYEYAWSGTELNKTQAKAEEFAWEWVKLGRGTVSDFKQAYEYAWSGTGLNKTLAEAEEFAWKCAKRGRGTLSEFKQAYEYGWSGSGLNKTRAKAEEFAWQRVATP